MPFHLRTAALSDVGRKRKVNQDFVTYLEPESPATLRGSGALYIVADGVGGASKGELASKYAAQKMQHDFYRKTDLSIEDRLQTSMRDVSFNLYQRALQSDGRTPMATTMVAAVIRGEWLTVANVGDSRAYLLRGGKIRQITKDHSIVAEMLRQKLITEEEAQRSKIRNRITRSLGGQPDTVVDIFKDIQLFGGDKILLCSDGLTHYASEADILRMTANGFPEKVTRRLIDFANKNGGADNISVIFVSVEEPSDELETTQIDEATTQLGMVESTGKDGQPSGQALLDFSLDTLSMWAGFCV